MGLRWDEVTGEWRQLRNELDYLYYTPNIIWAIKTRRMRWVKHVARIERGDEHTRVWCEILLERDHLEDPDTGGRTLLKCTFKYWDEGMNFIDLAQNRDKLWELVKAVLNLRVP